MSILAALPEWVQCRRPKRPRGESLSLMPLREEVEDRNNRAQSQAASPQSRASCLSQPGTSGHVSSSCPQKTSRALCCVLLEHASAPSTGFSSDQIPGAERSRVDSIPGKPDGRRAQMRRHVCSNCTLNLKALQRCDLKPDSAQF